MNNRAMVFMLKSVYKRTENEGSRETARKLLLAYSTTVSGPDCLEIQRAKCGVYGDFIKAVCSGDFFDAYQLADGSNRDALGMGMHTFLSPVSMGEASNIYDDGIEPSDYLPNTEEVKQ